MTIESIYLLAPFDQNIFFLFSMKNGNKYCSCKRVANTLCNRLSILEYPAVQATPSQKHEKHRKLANILYDFFNEQTFVTKILAPFYLLTYLGKRKKKKEIFFLDDEHDVSFVITNRHPTTSHKNIV